MFDNQMDFDLVRVRVRVNLITLYCITVASRSDSSILRRRVSQRDRARLVEVVVISRHRRRLLKVSDDPASQLCRAALCIARALNLFDLYAPQLSRTSAGPLRLGGLLRCIEFFAPLSRDAEQGPRRPRASSKCRD